MTIKVSVIIASLNRHDELRTCLQSIILWIEQYNLHNLIEVIVVDQSDYLFDDGDNIFEHKNFTLLRSSIKNASHARNFGSHYSSGDFLWFMDDDAVLLNLEISKINIFERDIYFIGWLEKIKIFKKNYYFNKLNILRKSGTPFYLISRKIFISIKGFNDNLGPGSRFVGGEDLDLLLRVNKIKRIDNFDLYGLLSHNLESSSTQKKYSYFKARGYVLGLNREYLLFLFNLLFDVSKIHIDGYKRVTLLVAGFWIGLR